MTLWHYTCDHGHAALQADPVVRPLGQHAPRAVAAMPPDLRWLALLSWWTDLDTPDIPGLGLTRETLACDRTTHRYRATHPERTVPWHRWARPLPRAVRLRLEAPNGALPAHWWVTTEPMPVTYDPTDPTGTDTDRPNRS